MYPYFRSLNACIISDKPVPFKNQAEYRVYTQLESRHWSDPLTGDFAPHKEEEGVVKSEEEMEATATLLYEILGIKDVMKSQRTM